MIKKLIYIIIPIIFFLFTQNVKAENIEHIEYTDPIYNKTFSYDLDTDKYPYYYLDFFPYSNSGVIFNFVYSSERLYYKENVKFSSGFTASKMLMPLESSTVVNYYYKNAFTGGSTGNGTITNVSFQNCSTTCNANYATTARYLELNPINVNSSIVNNTYTNYGNGILALISFDILDENNNLIYNKNYFNNNNGYLTKPELSYSLEPIYKDGYISSYGIKVNSTLVDDTLYKYQYAINDDTNDNLKWVDLYNNNFLNNQFSYVTKKPIYFYFRILDKSNNEVIDSFTITVTFNLVSPQYEIIFNQSKFYLNGTNYIDRVGLSITYKTSVDGLKYQYQYVNDGSSLDENNWVDTESDIYKVYNVNGVLYARILDNDNNVLYSHSFTNTLIGTQDILENPTNFPLYNKVQSILNFNKGSISDLVLIPVKVLMFMTDSLNRNVCNEYSFGSLLGHELKLPCIDIKSYVGNTIYNFYDLVCSFFISLGIIKLLKNIYMRFMTLEIRDIDNKGGIF